MESVLTISAKPPSPVGRERPPASPEERAQAVAARLAETLAAAWRRGERVRAEDLLAGVEELEAFPQTAFLVVREELRLRREFGPSPLLHEFLRRFPRWEAELLYTFDTRPERRGGEGEPDFPARGETLAGCRLLAELGRGAQGRVFLAAQTDLADRPVVLKIGPCNGHEHLTLARLLHTHIVPLHFAQDFPERHVRVLCMPYLGGATLEQLLAEFADTPPAGRTGRDLLAALDRVQSRAPVVENHGGPIRARLASWSYVEAVCWLGACLAEALHHAHERGMVHLDLKPSNVLLAGDGQPLLLDFHLARAPLAAGDPPLAWFGGTPGFMSPEQERAVAGVRGRGPVPEAVDGRSDVYSLGTLLTLLLGGSSSVKGDRRRALRQGNPRVSVGLADIVAKCLAADPCDRYQQAGALAADLRRHLSHQPLVGAGNRSPGERWRKWRRRNPGGLVRAALLLVVLAAAAVVTVTVLAYWNGRRAEAERALAEGKELLDRGLPSEAERPLERGLGLAEWLPGSAPLAQQLADKRREARRACIIRDLHQTADDLRFQYDPDALPAEHARTLVDSCDRLWEARAVLLALATEDENRILAEQVRADLLDLAVLGVDLRTRAASAPARPEATRRALVVLDEAEKEFGADPVLRHERGRLQTGRPDPADKEAPPRTARDHYALGRALLGEGDTERAAGEFDRAVALEPQGFWPNFYQGACAYRRGRFDEAESAFRVCVALAPDSAPCYYNRGLARAALHQTGRAREDYTRAVELDPGLGSAWLNRAVLDYGDRQWDRALDDLREALDRGADPGLVHYNLALTHLARGEQAVARNDAEAALHFRPNDAAALQLLTKLKGAQ